MRGILGTCVAYVLQHVSRANTNTMRLLELNSRGEFTQTTTDVIKDDTPYAILPQYLGSRQR